MPRRLNRLALVASLAAVLVVTGLILTFVEADRLMRAQGKPLASFSSNIMPDYRLASFPSLDEQTRLSGWFFPARGEPISTIILVHDNLNNRLQFDLDSPSLYEFLVEQQFNVLAFDLRSAGQSDGQLSTYGYAEWADVLAAIKYVQQFSTTRDVVLYGFGSGVSASMMAWQELPAPEQEKGKLDKHIEAIGFDRSYIRAIILDTPATSPDEYIQADCRESGWLGQVLLQHTVPYAIRLSAGHAGSSNLITLVTQMQIPVFMTWCEPDSHIGNDAITPIIEERLRLHPDTTQTHKIEQKGSREGWMLDREGTKAALESFLDRYVQNR